MTTYVEALRALLEDSKVLSMKIEMSRRLLSCRFYARSRGFELDFSGVEGFISEMFQKVSRENLTQYDFQNDDIFKKDLETLRKYRSYRDFLLMLKNCQNSFGYPDIDRAILDATLKRYNQFWFNRSGV